MKRAAIVALLCVNAVLLVMLVAGPGAAPKAYGQVIGSNYLVVTGNIYSDYDAIYILDLSTRRLAAWRYEKRKRPYGMSAVAAGRELLRDFGRTTR